MNPSRKLSAETQAKLLSLIHHENFYIVDSQDQWLSMAAGTSTVLRDFADIAKSSRDGYLDPEAVRALSELVGKACEIAKVLAFQAHDNAVEQAGEGA